ncbi:MAG: hypothetical protein N2654_01640 [Deltaproteobacteria bacterium]|nr:hypothetical protein [Deltaproteobacteria bacterium]
MDAVSCFCDKAEYVAFNKALKVFKPDIVNFYVGGLSDEILENGLETTIFVDYRTNEKFIKLFRQAFGYDPAPSALMAFAGANFIAEVIRSSPKDILNAIRSREHQGEFLKIKFNQRNSLEWENPEEIFTVIDKERRVLE